MIPGSSEQYTEIPIRGSQFIKALLEIPMIWRKSCNHILTTFLKVGNKKPNAMDLNYQVPLHKKKPFCNYVR